MSVPRLNLLARALIVGSLVISPGQSRAEAFLTWFDQNTAASSDDGTTGAFYGDGRWHTYETNPVGMQPRERLDCGGSPSIEDHEGSPARGSSERTERDPAIGEPARERAAR